MSMEFGDEYLAQLWEQIDWNAAESKLAGLQRRLSIAPSGKTIRGSLMDFMPLLRQQNAIENPR